MRLSIRERHAAHYATGSRSAYCDEVLRFPPAYVDFTHGVPVRGLSTAQVEKRVRLDLRSGSPIRVRDGLSNVLYWGYAQMGGLAMVRVSRLRTLTTPSSSSIVAATHLFSRCACPALFAIKRLRLPQFSGVSFISKVRMFLDPGGSATLDQQIMRIHAVCAHTVLAGVSFRAGATQIAVTRSNSDAYEDWCERLRNISKTYFPKTTRVVDVERGFFHLVQRGNVHLAAIILHSA